MARTPAAWRNRARPAVGGSASPSRTRARRRRRPPSTVRQGRMRGRAHTPRPRARPGPARGRSAPRGRPRRPRRPRTRRALPRALACRVRSGGRWRSARRESPRAGWRGSATAPEDSSLVSAQRPRRRPRSSASPRCRLRVGRNGPRGHEARDERQHGRRSSWGGTAGAPGANRGRVVSGLSVPESSVR